MRALRWSAVVVIPVALVGVLAATGGLERSEDRAGVALPGAELELARWSIALPQTAGTWAGSAYSSFEPGPDDPAYVGVELDVTLRDIESTLEPSRLVEARLQLVDGDSSRLSDDDRGIYFRSDGGYATRVHPDLAAPLLVVWELPETIDPDQIESVELRFHDEHQIDSLQGVQWVRSDDVTSVVIPVTMLDQPPVAEDDDG